MLNNLVGDIINQIILLKTMIIVTAVGTLLLLGVLTILCRKFTWDKLNLRVIGFFYDAKLYDTILLAVCLLKFYLVVSILITKGKIYLVHIFFYGLLVLIYCVLRHKIKETLVSLFNAILIMGILYVANFLISYLENVLFDVKIVIALAFLAIFLILYALYDMVGCILNIVSSRDEKRITQA